MDVLASAGVDSTVAWWENDGSENFTEHTIDGSYGGAICVYAADMDGDDEIDVLSASNWQDDITFWQNARRAISRFTP